VTRNTSGLDAATVKELSDQGVKCTIFDLNEEANTALASETGGAFTKVNVSNEQSMLDGIKLATNKHSPARILVNCAGIGTAGKTLGRKRPHDLKSFQKTITVNLINTFNYIRLMAAEMAKLEPDTDDERGVIINTASVAAYEGQIGQAAYSAFKLPAPKQVNDAKHHHLNHHHH